ncbi:IclR family transcriptional regulator [Kribbella sp. NPDC004536]|uniref:IclR family transcriptional regulator n=1 Tax=Kribbella sp. NPDC004536 TaxID=3364106 RepID=UPI0036B56E51
MTERQPRSRVQSVDRAALVLEILAGVDARGAGLGDIAEKVGVARSTAHALLRTLEANGLVAEVAGPRFVLGTALIRLGDIASRHLPIADLARPVLSALARETGLTTRLAIADNGYPVFVARVDGPGIVRFHTPLGARETPNSSAAGKVILSDLADEEVRAVLERDGLPRRTAKTIVDAETLLHELATVRARGFAVDDEEDLEGVFCVAAGVRSAAGRVVGAVSATGIASELRTRSIDELGTIVARHATDLTTRLTR